MGFKFKLIRHGRVPTFKVFQEAIRAENARVRAGIRQDFQATVATWETDVKFTTRERGRGNKLIFDVRTASEIYHYVSEGTEPHLIVPRRPLGTLAFQTGYSAKTRPGFIGSMAGGGTGGVAFAKFVQHPGTEGRHFEEAISKKWQKIYPSVMTQVITKVARQFS